MALTTLPTAALADDAVDNTKLDLADNYAFTGTVTGTPRGPEVAEFWTIQNGSTTTSTKPGTFTSPIFYDGINGSAQMTQSSGVFTFPSTGYYYVNFIMNVYDNGEEHRQFVNYIKLSTNSGVDWATRSQGSNFLGYYQSNNTHSSTYTHVVLDIANTSTHKLRFDYWFSNTSLTLYSDQRDISAYIQKLGET